MRKVYVVSKVALLISVLLTEKRQLAASKKICLGITDPKLSEKKDECLNIYAEFKIAESHCEHQSRKLERKRQRKRPLKLNDVDHCKSKEILASQWKEMVTYILVQEGVVPRGHPCTIFNTKSDVVKCMDTTKSIPKIREACRDERNAKLLYGKACLNYSESLASVPKRKSRKGACAWHHHEQQGFCLPNICSCENGTPVSPQRCGEHLKNKCGKCDYGFHLDIDKQGICKDNDKFVNLFGVNPFMETSTSLPDISILKFSTIVDSSENDDQNGDINKGANIRRASIGIDSEMALPAYLDKVPASTDCVQYHVSHGVHFWNQGTSSAKKYCEEQGLTMATIRNKRELKKLDNLLGRIESIQWGKKVYRREAFWIGGSRLDQVLPTPTHDHNSHEFKTWVWNADVHDTVDRDCQFWGKGLPDNGDMDNISHHANHHFDEYCMQIKPRGFKGCNMKRCTGNGPFVWDDEWCGNSLRVVCEDRKCVPSCN